MLDKKYLSGLSQEEKKFLIDQVIDENSPGTILADFETLLNFVGKERLQVSGKFNLLPLKIITELNEKLQQPIEVRLKRPQQKSYPNINGLYLLLRFTGLAQVKLQGKNSYWN